MLKALFGRKRPVPTTYVIASLNARVQPLDRGALYGRPLNKTLVAAGLGEVTGGGTQMAEEGIAHIDIEIDVVEADERTLSVIQERLESLGAPKGSWLTVGSTGERIDFGINEGLAVYLNITDLPEHVYEEHDVNDLVPMLEANLGKQDSNQGHWNGNRETALFFYGPSYESMVASMREVLENHPLCQKVRLEKIA